MRVAMDIRGKCLLASVQLLFGSCLTILWKTLLTLQGTGHDGEQKAFHKPLFSTMEMFFAMLLLLPAYRMKQCMADAERDAFLQTSSNQGSSGLQNQGTKWQHLREGTATSDSSGASASAWDQHSKLAIPAICDLVVTGLEPASLIILPGSVWQMLSGSRIIFTALLTVTLLQRKVHIHHCLGALLASVGVLIISVATVADSSDRQDFDGNMPTPSMIALGVGIELLAQLTAALQDVLEEKLMTELEIDPLKVVGMEGAWGLLIITCLIYPFCWLLPGHDVASLEDPVDTLYMIKSSIPIQLVLIVMIFVDATYNAIRMNVIKFLTAVMLAMISSSKAITVWMFNMGWYHFVDKKAAFGEAWSNMGYFKVIGFAFLVAGQLTYGGDYRWSCFHYPQEMNSEDDGE